MLYLIEILHQTTTVAPTTATAQALYLIEILHQTTTWSAVFEFLLLLYLIEILHQTTTSGSAAFNVSMLYLIEILHQTTTMQKQSELSYGCILSKFYIKPQQARLHYNTSGRCILSKFYIKPQPGISSEISMAVVSYRNSTSNHNILIMRNVSIIVVSYRNSTSNHNSRASKTISAGLYLIEILHQTTTQSTVSRNDAALYLIEILHQTTTQPQARNIPRCCILSKFYIKPQQISKIVSRDRVVSYRNSTSNHNSISKRFSQLRLYLIEILHQTTTPPFTLIGCNSCILSKFYIKPQPGWCHRF